MRKPPPSASSAPAGGATTGTQQQQQHDRSSVAAAYSTTSRIVMLWVFTSAFVTSQYFLARENKAKAREAVLMAQIGALRREVGAISKSQQGIHLHRELIPDMPEEAQPMETSAIAIGPVSDSIAGAAMDKYRGDVEFIPNEKLEHGVDIFAAAWWQRMPRFLELDVERYLLNVEADAFKPILRAGNGFDDVRMTRDWLDFSVEHLSKWWKMGEQPAMFSFAVGKLQSYIHRTLAATDRHDTVMDSTLALIPFGVSDKTDNIGQQMWMISLAATIASVIQHGVARVVVVGYYNADTEQAMQAFRYLLDHEHHGIDAADGRTVDKPSSSARIKGDGVDNSPFSAKWGNTELAFVHTDDVETKYIAENVPKGALNELQMALRGEKSKSGVKPKYWLGKKGGERFKYLYFTECDEILNARLRPSFLDTLDEGRIIVPHRLQPFPHPLDLENLFEGRKTSVVDLTDLSDMVAHLRPDVDACCDTGERLRNRQGISGFWWQYGFNGHGNFTHLKAYDFMRLTSGTGIVSLASTEHSRRCRPVANVASCESVPIVKNSV